MSEESDTNEGWAASENGGVNGEIERARAAVLRAAETTDEAAVREQLRSIEIGLTEMTESASDPGSEASTEGDVPDGDDLEEVEQKVVSLASETDEPTQSHLEDARDSIDAYRVRYTRDW